MSSQPIPAALLPEASPRPSHISGKRAIRETASLVFDEKDAQDNRGLESKRARCGLLLGTGAKAKHSPAMNVGETPMDQEGDEHANLNDHDEYPLSNFSSRANTFGATCPTVSPFAVGPSSAATLPNSVAHPPTPYRNGQTVATPSNAVIGAKKLIIRNFKHRAAQSGGSLFDSSWRILEEAVIAIQKKRKVNASLEQLYRTVENLCEHKLSMEIYTHLKQCLVNHVRSELQLLLGDSHTTVLFLQRLDALWQEHCQQMVMIRSVFLFLDRTFVLQNSTVASLWDVGLEIFRDVIMNNDRIRKRTTDDIMKLIETEREGAQIDRQLVKSLLRMMSSLGIYQSVFERRFLETTTALYENEGRNLSRDLEVPAYLLHVKRRLEEESNRVDYYLDASTRKELMAVAEKSLIVDHMEAFIDKGVEAMLHGGHCDDLALIYSLLARTKNGLTHLKNAFAAYIKKVGKAMVTDTERDKTLVADLLVMKGKLDNILKSCFENNEKFVQAEKDAFDYFINTRANKPAELVAKYLDSKLRSGNKESTDEELEILMDQVIVLFRFIQGKDVFEAFYKKDLAKRLLLGRSASVDAEKSMLSKLKQECGAGFTTKLEGMFKDMELSKDLAVAFKQYFDHGGPDRTLQHSDGRIEFSVNVLTMGHWPSYEPMDVVIPPYLAEYQELFKRFYLSKHSGRKLQWQHSLAQVLLRAHFKPSVVKELQVSMFQALVLLLFNEKTEWTVEEISASTKIEKGELERTLQSLACGRLRVLLKTPRGKDIKAHDKLTFNGECNDKLYRIRISQVQMKETAEEHSQTEEQIFQDRQYQIDAAIVRIMKTRKSLAHQLLISELFKQLRFSVKAVDLKKRIESLIEREYMCRDKEDPNTYNYVA
uniref:Cullin-4 n=1 Tax=Ascaris suum TaxID=6253 RepID=F1KTC7_ASCSU